MGPRLTSCRMLPRHPFFSSRFFLFIDSVESEERFVAAFLRWLVIERELRQNPWFHNVVRNERVEVQN